MATTYKYHIDRHTIYRTILHLVIYVILGFGLYYLYEGGYLSAWFTLFIVMLIALMCLSIPRTIVVKEQTVEIRCLLDITELNRDEIASIRRVTRKQIKWFIPLFGAYGFFGYYGHFIDLKRFDRVRMYATQRNNLVEITDIYEDRLYISCNEADRLIEELTPQSGNQPIDDDEIN